jgi:arylsulfatase
MNLPFHWRKAVGRRHLLVCLALFLVGAAGLPVAAELAGRRPNIVVVLTDDQGYGEVGAHGNPVIRTPQLDRLHAASVRFTDFHVSPTCAPTRSALLTGRHEFKNGVTHTIFERERLTLAATTLPQVMQTAGYATGIFGKWHLGDEEAYQPGRRGFDEVFVHGGGGIGQTYPGSCGDAPGNGYFDPAIRHNGRFVKTRGYCTDVFFRQALEWIGTRRETGRPFFACVTPNAPHDPFISPGPAYEAPYRDQDLSTNAVAYYAMISNLDENVGRLLARLREWRIETNTLVIFLTDNGHSVPGVFNAGMRGMKGGPYQGGTRVPSFWYWPGTLTPGDRPQFTAHVDVFRTLAGLAGATLPPAVEAQVEGRNLLPLLTDPQAAWPDRTRVTHVGRWEYGQVATAKHRQCSIRNARFRLVNDRELYDLTADPAEARNVLAEHPAVVAELRAAYDRWWEEIQPCLVNESALGPPVNPFKAAYWDQFGGGPDDGLRRRMDPSWKLQSRLAP